MNTTRLTDTRLLVLSIVLSGGIFAVDLSLPLGVAGGVPYAIVVLVSLWSPKRRDTYLAAGAGTTLTVLGYFLSTAGGLHWMALANRFLALCVIWVTALLTLRYKRAEEGLRESELRFRQLAENIDHVFWLTDWVNRTLLYVSPAYETVFRRSCRSLYEDRHSWIENIYPDEKARVAESFAQSAERGVFVEEEYRIVHADGRTSWIRDRAFPIRDEQGMVYRVVGLAEDITGRKSAEEALRLAHAELENRVEHRTAALRATNLRLECEAAERQQAEEALRLSERRYRELIDALPHGIEECDLNGTIMFSSPGNDRLKGYDLGEVVGQKIWDCSVSEEAARGLQRWVRQLVSEQPAPTPWIGQIKLRDERLLDVQVDWNYKHANDGRLTGFVSVITDITPRRRAEAQVHKHQEELAHMSRLSTMGEMATGFAHELNQPLASIVHYTSGCVQRIQAGRPDLQELVAVLNDASSEAQRAGEVIKRIRRFVQQREPARTTIDMSELIRQVLDLMRYDLMRHDIQTRLEVEEHMPTFQGDRIQLQQVLLNLLRNSVEAMNGTERKHRRLTVGATTNNSNSMTVFVRDTGCGLGEVDPDSVFEAFYTTKEDGTGMGLAISRTIIEAHGGHLKATNNADEGCTFQFSLPRNTEA